MQEPSPEIVEKYAKAQASLARTILRAREDFTTFVTEVWSNDPDLVLEDFHREAIEAFTNRKRTFVYWEAPRGHGKSLIAVAFICWLIGRDPNERIKIICANDKEARKRLFEIKEQITKNKMMQLVFPHLRRDTASEWNKSRITVERTIMTKDPSIEAMGVMSGSLGSRATAILFDDIVDLRNSVLQPQLRGHVKTKVFGEILPLLEPTGIIRALGTPWGVSDVNAIMKDSDGWHTVGPHRVGNREDPFAPIWPYRFTRDRLKELHDTQGPTEFARAYWCKALTKDTVPIQPAWLKFYNSRLLGDPNKLLCVQAYDLAISQSNEADYFAHVTLLWDEKRNYIFVPHAWHERLTFRQQSKRIAREAAIWHPQLVVLESGGYQGALESYIAEDTRSMIEIYPYRTRGRSKERRLVEASPFLEKGQVFFHPKFNPRRNPDIANTGDIITELTSFPFAKHDDMVDALTMGILTLLEMNPADDEEGYEDTDTGDDAGIGLTII